MRLRSWLGVMLMAAVVAVNAAAWAQNYPDRPVRILIAFPGGGTIDTLGRILAQKLTEAWGQNVVIENRPGAAAISVPRPRRSPRPTAIRCISARKRSPST